MLSRGRLTQLLTGSLDLKIEHQAPTSAPDDLLGLTVQVSLKRVGREMRMLVENADDQTPADPSLLRIIARAHHIQARLIHNTKLTMNDIAREERVSAAYIYSLLRLPWLAPGITTAIVNGRKRGRLGMNKGRLTSLVRLSYLGPEIVRALLAGSQSNALTPSRLLRLSKNLPHDWKEQRCFLGFAA